ncbi:MAG: SoxR reducing system RseC family protein [Clostridiales bacterium]|nr:SoxR reducing system RseC family protein [Clostridiales bacterium]
MEQIAKITKVLENGLAEVEVRRQTSCGHDCDSCHGCGAPKELIRVTAVNTAKAKAGDSVLVSSDSGKILGLAVLFYLVPILLFFVFYQFQIPFRAFTGGINGAIGFFAGIAVLYFVNHRLLKSNKVVFTITSVLNEKTVW